jgi:uncharacterized protein (DUF1697 family)
MHYLSLLRGINVGGQKQIKMQDLQKLYLELGFTEIQTYIQSGNVLFETAENVFQVDLAQVISQKIQAHYGFSVEVLVLDLADLQAAIQQNPFAGTNHEEKTYFTFLATQPEESLLQSLLALDYAPEQIQIIGQTVYFYSPQGYGNAKLNNNLIEKKLKTVATTRNWKTTVHLCQLLQERNEK